MLNSQQEAQVLKGAIRRGWISEDDVLRVPASSDGKTEPATFRYSPKLDYLLQSGRLKEAAIGELIQEARSADETCDPRAAESPAPDEHEASRGLNISPSVVSLGKPSALSGGLAGGLGQLDRYEVQELLGHGGNGSVYKAVDRRLNRTVALKFIHAMGAQAAQLLMREARAQARIDHPGVCKVHEVGEFADQLYISMEYLPGDSLQDAQQSMTLEEKVCVIKDVAEALHAAHQLGIIHRDIKPGSAVFRRWWTE